jgi:hypothetical protein
MHGSSALLIESTIPKQWIGTITARKPCAARKGAGKPADVSSLEKSKARRGFPAGHTP